MIPTYKEFSDPVESNRYMINLYENKLHDHIENFNENIAVDYLSKEIIKLDDEIKRRKLIDNINKLECTNESII